MKKLNPFSRKNGPHSDSEIANMDSDRMDPSVLCEDIGPELHLEQGPSTSQIDPQVLAEQLVAKKKEIEDLQTLSDLTVKEQKDLLDAYELQIESLQAKLKLKDELLSKEMPGKEKGGKRFPQRPSRNRVRKGVHRAAESSESEISDLELDFSMHDSHIDLSGDTQSYFPSNKHKRTFVTPEFEGGDRYSLDVIKKAIKTMSATFSASMIELNISAYLDQFKPLVKYERVSEMEWIAIVVGCLPEPLKGKVKMYPHATRSVEDLIQALEVLTNGSLEMIKTKIETYSPSAEEAVNIMLIFNSLYILVKRLTSHVGKQAVLLQTHVVRFLPPDLKSNWHNMFRFVGGEVKRPSIGQLSGYLRFHERLINSYLRDSKGKKGNQGIRKANSNANNGSNAKKDQNQKHDSKKNTKNDQKSAKKVQGSRATSPSNSSVSTSKKFFKVFPACTFCGLTNHEEDKCFKHENKSKAEKNRKDFNDRKLKNAEARERCLKCGSIYHLAVSCKVYTRKSFEGQPCQICRDLDFGNLFHAEAECRFKDSKNA